MRINKLINVDRDAHLSIQTGWVRTGTWAINDTWVRNVGNKCPDIRDGLFLNREQQ